MTANSGRGSHQVGASTFGIKIYLVTHRSTSSQAHHRLQMDFHDQAWWRWKNPTIQGSPRSTRISPDSRYRLQRNVCTSCQHEFNPSFFIIMLSSQLRYISIRCRYGFLEWIYWWRHLHAPPSRYRSRNWKSLQIKEKYLWSQTGVSNMV